MYYIRYLCHLPENRLRLEKYSEVLSIIGETQQNLIDILNLNRNPYFKELKTNSRIGDHNKKQKIPPLEFSLHPPPVSETGVSAILFSRVEKFENLWKMGCFMFRFYALDWILYSTVTSLDMRFFSSRDKIFASFVIPIYQNLTIYFLCYICMTVSSSYSNFDLATKNCRNKLQC